MTMMRIAAKAQALPSTSDDRLAKIPKASLTTQKKPRDSSRCIRFHCHSIGFDRSQAEAPYPCRSRNCGAAHSATAVDCPLATEDQTEHKTDPECGKDCLRRVRA